MSSNLVDYENSSALDSMDNEQGIQKYVGAGSPETWQPDDNFSKPAPPALPPAGLAHWLSNVLK